MRTENVILEMIPPVNCRDDYIFNLVYLDTGEIRQKRRSPEWVMRRIFFYELKLREKKYGERVAYEEKENER